MLQQVKIFPSLTLLFATKESLKICDAVASFAGNLSVFFVINMVFVARSQSPQVSFDAGDSKIANKFSVVVMIFWALEGLQGPSTDFP